MADSRSGSAKVSPAPQAVPPPAPPSSNDPRPKHPAAKDTHHGDPREKLIVALDVSTAADAQKIVSDIGESVLTYKVGMQLYTAEGPQLVRDLVASGHKVFLDLKYHDIPNTVAAAVKEAAQLGVSLLTVHALGGAKMLRAATEAAQTVNPELKVLGVTVLTSMGDPDLEMVGVQGDVLDEVLRLATLAIYSGCHGIVSSAREAPELRKALGKKFALVTPGVRPTGSGHADQVRVVTPAQAIAAGASHIVVGRPITAAADPAAEAKAILKEIAD